jgi:hypothetical protein
MDHLEFTVSEAATALWSDPTTLDWAELSTSGYRQETIHALAAIAWRITVVPPVVDLDSTCLRKLPVSQVPTCLGAKGQTFGGTLLALSRSHH